MSPYSWLALAGVMLLIGGLSAWFLSSRALRHLRRRMRRATIRALKKFRVRLNRWKLSPKSLIHAQLMKDDEIVDGIVEHSREHDCKLAEAEQRAEFYVDEIIPAFQLFTYYVFGYLLARGVLNLIYKVDVGSNEELDDDFHERNTVVYVANHRSNADYVLLSYVLTDRVAISYAVGEWARVWPLEPLFKSLGSYFIRRGFREKLYHTVLRRYVQLITLNGVTQGVFIEGGLSRDGKLRPAKVGMLDYLTQILRDPKFKREDLVFVPVGLNYDRVLEDRPLTGERRRKKAEDPEAPAEQGRSQKRRGVMFRRVMRLLFSNYQKYRQREIRRHGRAAVRFGEPVSFKAWQEAQGHDVVGLERKERLGEIAEFAHHLLGKIGEAVPATPVTVFCLALQRLGKHEGIGADELRASIAETLGLLRDAGVPSAPDELDLDFVFTRGSWLLTMRRVLEQSEERYSIHPKSRSLVRYYAWSLEHHLSGEIPRSNPAPKKPEPTNAAAQGADPAPAPEQNDSELKAEPEGQSADPAPAPEQNDSELKAEPEGQSADPEAALEQDGVESSAKSDG